MKFKKLQKEISKYVYTEDDGMTRIALASIISTRMKLGEPIWLTIIGPSSSGKSQLLRPLAMTDKKFIHRVDDLTENTFLSGIKVKAGKKDISLLKQIGNNGIIIISDFTIIFSKSPDTKNALLSQFRMIYDGEMTKYSGNRNKPLHWEGSLGIIAGSTPVIYEHFEEVADMGERFISYRMKSYNEDKATMISLKRKLYGRELDELLSDYYADYLKDCIVNIKKNVPKLSNNVLKRIMKIAKFATQLSTPTSFNKYTREVERVPIKAAPMRMALQFSTLARGLSVIQYNNNRKWKLEEDDLVYIERCAYSLANEEKRACLKILAEIDFGSGVSTQAISDEIDLSTNITRVSLQNLTAIGVLKRSGDQNGLTWSIKDKNVFDIIRRMENIKKSIIKKIKRVLSSEEIEEKEKEIQSSFDLIDD